MSRLVIAICALGVGFFLGWVLFGSTDAERRRAERPPAAADGESAPGGFRHRVAATPDSADEPDIEEVVRRRIVETYRERTGQEVPRDMLDAAVAEILSRLDKLPPTYATWAAHEIQRRERHRREVGEIGEPVALLLQVRTGRSGRVSLLTGGSRHSGIDTLAAAPLDVQIGVVRGDPTVGYVVGGVVPPGKVLLIERVELSARAGSIEVGLRADAPLRWQCTTPALRATLTGQLLVPPGEEHEIYLQVGIGTGELRLSGKLLRAGDASRIAPAPLVVGEHKGLLTGQPVVLQVLADHGGGNPRTINLAGGHNGRIDRISFSELWRDDIELRKLGHSSAYFRGAGVVPPGKAFRIHRIEYRAKLDAGSGKHSDFVLSAGREVLFRTNASRQTTVADVWSGSLLIPPGEERGVRITCSYFGMGEAIIYGELIDAR